MIIKNRNGKNLLTSTALGVTSEQLEILKILYKNTSNVYRFGRVKNMTAKNSVKTHTRQLLKLADFLSESLDDEQIRKDLRLLAFIHDLGEILGELTVAHEDVVNASEVTRSKKELYEFEIFKAAYCAARTGEKQLKLFIAKSVGLEKAEDLYNYAKEYNTRQEVSTEEFNLFKKFVGKGMNKMVPIYLKCIDRAEGTIFYCGNSEDLDLTQDSFMERMIAYNLKSLYEGTPFDLGGDDNLISVYKKAKSILKAATRHYKYLCREDKYDFFSNAFNSFYDSLGRFYTWGDHEYVYFAKYWKLSDLFKIIGGEFKVYKSLEDVYSVK